ncbi:MAG: SDR family oxidoreductase [Nitrospirae bacterium]|nr:SDR family oxidoreductase [Nitrospirota bacterium]
MSTYLVTGGAGFIGSNIVDKLVENKEKVRVLDNFSTGKRENLKQVAANIDLIEGDIRDLATCQKAMEGVDFCLHQAALPSVQRSVEDPLTTNEVNVNGTLNILFAAKEAAVKRVVYAGSSSAYGNTPTLPKREDMTPNPLSPYAVTKLVGEYYCRAFQTTFGLSTVILRYFNVFGPRQDPNSLYSAVIPKFITAMLSGNSPTIYGDGEQSRDFTYIENVVQANLLACKAKGVEGEIFNIAMGERVIINELIGYIDDLLATSLTPTYAEARAGDVKHSLADISKAEKLLEYHPEVSFEEGLGKTIKGNL